MTSWRLPGGHFLTGMKHKRKAMTCGYPAIPCRTFFATVFCGAAFYNEIDGQGGMAVTVVYIDSVFVLNALIDYLLLLTAAYLAGIPLQRRRYLIAALLGGSYAAAVLFPGMELRSSWQGKLAAGVLLCGIAFAGTGRCLRMALLSAAVSCGFAGCVMGLGMLSGGAVPVVRGIFYTNIGLQTLLLSAVAVYLLLTVAFRARAAHAVSKELLPVVICCGERRVFLTALCDTGNEVRDPLTGRPVLVASLEHLTGLWQERLGKLLTADRLRDPPQVLGSLDADSALRFQLLPYRAVGASGGLLLAFRSDWTKIGRRTYSNLLIAISPTELRNGYGALWGKAERSYRDGEAVQGHMEAAAEKAGTFTRGSHSLYRRK